MQHSKDNQDAQWQPGATHFTTYTVESAHVEIKDITTAARGLAHSLTPVRAIEGEFLGGELCFPRPAIAINAEQIERVQPLLMHKLNNADGTIYEINEEFLAN